MISSSTSLVFALALFLTIVVSPSLASSAAERAAAASCGNPAVIPTLPGSGLNVRYRGAVAYPSAFSFSSVRWFAFTPNCNVTAATPAPTPAATSVVGYSLSIPTFVSPDVNPSFRGVGYESFQLTSFFNVQPITQLGEISLRIGNESLGQNNGNPPDMTNLIAGSLSASNKNYGLLSTPVVQFKNGVVVGLSLQLVYPKLPDVYGELNSRLAETKYDQYYNLVIEGNTWIISEFATGNIRASGFFDSVPCANLIPGNPSPTVCNGIPN